MVVMNNGTNEEDSSVAYSFEINSPKVGRAELPELIEKWKTFLTGLGIDCGPVQKNTVPTAQDELNQSKTI